MGWSLARSRVVYAGSYAVALALALVVAFAVSGPSAFERAAIAGGVATLFFFGCSVVFKNSGFYDCYWSLAPVICGVAWIAGYDAWAQPRAVLAAAVTAVWGIRLTANWAKHFQGLDHEDWRYVDLRRKTGGAYLPASFGALHVFPFVLVTAGSYPLHEAIAKGGAVGPLDMAATLVGVGAVVLETVADRQLHAFRRTNRDPRAFLQSGLWAYSRHPNYCGEAMYWWSIALFGLAARPSSWMVLGAAGVTCMIVFASIPMAEERALAKRPAFAEYQRRVSRLIPWFSR